jgi:hypothetical protein
LAYPATTWTDILSAIGEAGWYVDLDISGCTMASTVFDPGSADTGKRYITGLVLPGTVTGIKAGSSGGATFRFFTDLKILSASGVTAVGTYVFYSCSML